MGRTCSRNVIKDMCNTLGWEVGWKGPSRKNEQKNCRVVLRYVLQGSGVCPLVDFGISDVGYLFGVFLLQRW